MIIYEVDDQREGFITYHRNLQEAKKEFKGVSWGTLDRIKIPDKITKDLIIDLLNHENFAIERLTLEQK